MTASNEEEEYSDEDKQSEQDTKSSTCVCTYTTCRNTDSTKAILAKGKSLATDVGNSEGEE